MIRKVSQKEIQELMELSENLQFEDIQTGLIMSPKLFSRLNLIVSPYAEEDTMYIAKNGKLAYVLTNLSYDGLEIGDIVEVYGKISQPETYLGSDYKEYTGERMKIVNIYPHRDAQHYLIELRWAGHRRNCHVCISQVKSI